MSSVHLLMWRRHRMHIPKFVSIFLLKRLFPKIKDTNWSVWRTGTHFVACAVPTDLKYAPGPSVAVHQCSSRSVPNVDALIEGATGEVFAIRTEGHAVDRLLVLCERVNTDSSLHVPQAHCRVERGTSEHDIRIRVVGSGACWTPLDSVDLFTVSLKVMDAWLLLHTPNL